jgi:hypothetical protein
MVLEWTQPLTEMSNTNIPGGKGRSFVRHTTPPPSVSRLSTKCGIVDIAQPYGPPRLVTMVALHFLIINIKTAMTRIMKYYLSGCAVILVTTVKNTIFWLVTQCNSSEFHRRSSETSMDLSRSTWHCNPKDRALQSDFDVSVKIAIIFVNRMHCGYACLRFNHAVHRAQFTFCSMEWHIFSTETENGVHAYPHRRRL